MKTIKFLFAFALFSLLATSVSAQNLTEAEVRETMNRGISLNKEGKFKEAIDAFLTVGQNTEAQRTEAERQTYVVSQTMACKCYEKSRNFEAAYLLAKKLLSGNITLEERKKIELLYVENGTVHACNFLKTNGDFNPEKARTIFYEVLPYADEKNDSIIRNRISSSWYFEGAMAELKLDYIKALPCMKKAAEGFMQIGNSKDAALVVAEIAVICERLYDLKGAMKYLQQAHSLAQRARDNNRLMEILSNEMRLNRSLGNIKEANRLTLVADSLAAADSSPKLQYAYNTLKAKSAKQQGNTELALLWFAKNGEYVAKEKGARERGVYYGNMRDLCIAQKNYEDALRYARLEMKEDEAISRRGSRFNYGIIASIYRLQDDRKNCFLALDTLFMEEKNLTEPRELEKLYTLRASCYNSFHEYEKALADFLTADSLLATKYDETDGDRIQLLSWMGAMYHKLKRYDESLRLYKRYAEGSKKIHGEDSDDYVDALSNLANAEAFAGQIEDGCTHYGETVDRLKTKVRRRLPYLTTDERDEYWRLISSLFTSMPPFAIKAQRTQTDFTRTCYDALILSKAFLLESDRTTYDILKKNGSEQDLEDFASMQSLSLKQKAWEKNYREHADSIMAVAGQIEKINRQLAARCSGYDDMTAFMDVDYEAVKDALGADDLLLDFTDYVSESKGRQYAAFVVSKQQDYPLLQPLFAERRIDSLEISRPEYFYEEPYATEVRKLLWQPFEPFVHEGMTVYYVPSQLLFQVSLESLPLADGSLLGEHYKIVRLSSARELLRYRPQLSVEKKHSAVLYGALQYDVEPAVMVAEAKKYEVAPLFALRGADIARGDSVFRALPETGKEVEAIGNILKEKGISVLSLTGTAGTEESFLNMSGQAPQILQVATHGFYYTPTEAQRIDYLQGYIDAMQLSGLVMAGGNAAWLGKELPQGVRGGIINANEIASLDFEGMEMAVLSACQTGQGEATAEGLYGLQRAFKKAGAKTLVMTLWSVNDAICREFMVSFYERLAANGWDKHRAFESAKAAIRQKYPEAFYWAGFIMLD